MTITIAHPSEAYILTEIAFAAKRHWGYPRRWMARWRSSLTTTPAMIASNDTFTARIGQQIVGFGALKIERGILTLCDLWVLPSEMGRGVGRALFRHAQQRTQALGFSTFEIQSDPHAAGFYERMGAEYVRTHSSVLDGQPRNLPVYVCSAIETAEQAT